MARCCLGPAVVVFPLGKGCLSARTCTRPSRRQELRNLAVCCGTRRSAIPHSGTPGNRNGDPATQKRARTTQRCNERSTRYARDNAAIVVGTAGGCRAWQHARRAPWPHPAGDDAFHCSCKPWTRNGGAAAASREAAFHLCHDPPRADAPLRPDLATGDKPARRSDAGARRLVDPVSQQYLVRAADAAGRCAKSPGRPAE